MLTDKIQEKLKELSTLPGVTAVGLGKKIIGGTQTDTIGITFGVKVKETNPENMLPTSVDIDGITYVTDVIEIGEIAFASCPANQPGYAPTSYIVSGIAIAEGHVDPSLGYIVLTGGTLGIIAMHTETNALVGVTAAHILADASRSDTVDRQALINAYRRDDNGGNGFMQFNYPFRYSIQFYTYATSGQANFIGTSFYYKPLKVKPVIDPDRFNQIDACLINFFTSLSPDLISVIPNTAGTSLEIITGFDPSWKSYLVKDIPEITDAMPFATTAELNALITSPPSFVSSTGAGSGAKNGPVCGLKIDGIGVTTSFTYSSIPGTVYFEDLISFSRITPGLSTVFGFDSGASLVAKIGGVWKIIGLVIGGNETVGYACRIDHIASELGIQAWDGSVKPFQNIYSSNVMSNTSYVTGTGINDADKIIIDNMTYYQAGNLTTPPMGYYE